MTIRENLEQWEKDYFCLLYTSTTIANSKQLAKIGITMKNDGTLSLDKDTFMKADMNTVKNLFQGNGSYGYRVSAQSSMTVSYTHLDVYKRQPLNGW